MTTPERGASRTNFGHLEAHDEQLVRLGMLAERYFAEDPNTALLKLRQLARIRRHAEIPGKSDRPERTPRRPAAGKPRRRRAS